MASRLRLATIRGPYTEPCVPHLVVVNLRVVSGYGQTKYTWRKASHRTEQRIRVHNAIPLRTHQRHARIDQLLLCVENIEGRTLAEPRLFAHTVQSGFR